MGNNYKKISSIVIVVIMIIGTLTPINAYANETYSYGNWEYIIVDGNITITRYLGSETNITIPNVIDGKKVTEIGDFVFSYCKNLEYITIPESVVTIKFSAFAFCNKLESITIPKNVANIEYFFEEYKGLFNINVESDNKFFSSKEGVLYNKDQKSLLFYPPAKKSSNFIVPNSVKNIREAAFAYSTGLERITIPQSVISIGQSAFFKCIHLKDVRLSNSITSIEKKTFYQCTEINSITIPQNVKKIGEQAFTNCVNLKEVNLSKNLVEIGYAGFEECRSLINITIPESVHKIGSNAFAFCEGLKSIIIPTNVTSIESCAFYKCINLKEVKFPQKLSVIEYKSFYGCTQLEEVVIPSGVSVIGNAAFMSCENLKTVKFMGKKPVRMEKYIFDECSQNLTILYPKKYKNSWSDYTDYPKASHNDVKISVSKVSLNKKKLILSKGKYHRLKCRITPLDADTKSVTWKSSNKKIATVSKKGVVKAKKVGTCIITVISKDGNKKARCKIRVILPVKKVKISEKQVSIKKGSKYTLKAVIKPKNVTIKKVVWSSSNKKVAKVSKGVVTGIKKGTCYITAKSKYENKKARCKVVVK